MQSDIDVCKQLGVAGVVLGLLLPSGEIDVPRTSQLVERARPLLVTFHRAFDMAKNLMQSAEQLIDMGIERVLTSGGAADAIQGQEVIKTLVSSFGDRLTILAGGGLTPDNIPSLLTHTHLHEVHASLRTSSPVWGRMQFKKDGVYMGGEKKNEGLSAEYARKKADAEKIKTVAKMRVEEKRN